jgi:hypothetical protein
MPIQRPMGNAVQSGRVQCVGCRLVNVRQNRAGMGIMLLSGPALGNDTADSCPVSDKWQFGLIIDKHSLGEQPTIPTRLAGIQHVVRHHPS